jgi:hypothetical protein
VFSEFLLFKAKKFEIIIIHFYRKEIQLPNEITLKDILKRLALKD